MFGLSVLKGDIANQEESFTRFLVIAKQPRKVDGRIPSKTAIVIHTLNKAGALVEALNVFKEHGINLTKLESRPIPGNSWEEMFYIDFLGNLESDLVKTALGDLTKLVRFIKVLGCYPACDVTPTEVAHSEPETCDTQSCESSSPRIEVKEPAAPKSSGKDKGYKLVSREHKSTNTIIDVGGVKIGDGNFLVIAGPCSVESREADHGVSTRTCAARALVRSWLHTSRSRQTRSGTWVWLGWGQSVPHNMRCGLAATRAWAMTWASGWSWQIRNTLGG